MQWQSVRSSWALVRNSVWHSKMFGKPWSISRSWANVRTGIPLVHPATTSRHSVCVLSCWPPQGPYTPPYHRKNKPSYQRPLTLCSGQSLYTMTSDYVSSGQTKTWQSPDKSVLWRFPFMSIKDCFRSWVKINSHYMTFWTCFIENVLR